MINMEQNAQLLIAGFTQREIHTQKRKFYNLFNVDPFLTPMRKKGEWVGLTTEETLDMFDLNNVYGSKWIEFARTVEAKLKEKNT